MQNQSLDFARDDTLAGFRLHRLEMYNWGTFDKKIWHIGPAGHNALLTGDIGSGKSTLVDAVTTLLVPHHRIIYNKAAGAQGKERDLHSYVRGQYKNEKTAEQAAKPVFLREENSYTVLLAYFYNQGFDQEITLAQVFWLKDQQHNPERFFVVAEGNLTIADGFGNFGQDILRLKKRLRRLPRVAVVDNFKEYCTRFRQSFGIQHEQALHLFYQTVSMKSVGNLTDFVRNHMLEASEVEVRINELRQSFDNLNRCHEAVVKARQRIEALTPLVRDGEEYQNLNKIIVDLRRCRDGLDAYFARHKIALLNNRIIQLQQDIDKNQRRQEALDREIEILRQQSIDLQNEINGQGGRRLQVIEQEVKRLTEERKVKKQKHDEYQTCLKKLEFPLISGEKAFYHKLAEAQKHLQDREEALKVCQRHQVDKAVELRELENRHSGIEEELVSLRRRKSNIPGEILPIRQKMLETLKLDESDLPYAGELLQVEEAEAAWAGAIERVLHNFGLSLLVPDKLYIQVSRYVDRTHLRGRLVYYRIEEAKVRQTGKAPVPGTLPYKLCIKPDSIFYDWLAHQLNRRFDYHCCESLEEFRRRPKAITRQGQIKSGRERHEKDDRHDVQDRRRFVLGWSNEEKIRALEAQQRQLEKQIQQLGGDVAALQKRQQALTIQRDTVRDLLKFKQYNEIHWQACVRQIDALQQERQKIEASSNLLQTLQAQLRQVEKALKEKDTQIRNLAAEKGKLADNLSKSRKDSEEARQLLEEWPEVEKKWIFAKLDAFRRENRLEAILTLKNMDKCQRELRQCIQKKFDSDNEKLKRLSAHLISRMQKYKMAWPAETSEVDAAPESIEEFWEMLRRLQEQDLPRHEERFKSMLNEGTINQVALFQGQLKKEQQDIAGKIDTINQSLRDIEYNPGTYIELVMDKTEDGEIRDFQQDLRQCLEHGLDGESDAYNEPRFSQVKKIIDRFNGREGTGEIDRRWTAKVTNVRNWFKFSASERWREDRSEKEFYSDTAGKSGGQKEKLAYTILASALAYQFGLEWNATQSRSFRFVVIDEAFGRGSDESTRYGLELFKKLNLQLLIVTPLQKIHIIEEYIAAVHFVHNEEGQYSMIRNLTIEEYRTEKQAHDHATGNQNQSPQAMEEPTAVAPLSTGGDAVSKRYSFQKSFR
ncbi:MAG: ATP-dependent exonuclease SbcCD, C subunit-like protein [Gammaproteobacteria bacterium]|nr:ATP-dependent exonuclease SbcCD, C subunit-like protein [Gammaproteobacteria bacterium]